MKITFVLQGLNKEVSNATQVFYVYTVSTSGRKYTNSGDSSTYTFVKCEIGKMY